MADNSRRSLSSVRSIAALAVLLAVAACQPVPRPFQPESKSLNAADLARLGTRGGIIVQGADLGAPELSARFAGFLGAAMRDAGLPALPAATDTEGRYILSGSFAEGAISAPDLTLRGEWTVADPLGQTVVRFTVQQAVKGAQWRAGDPATMVLVAEATADALASRLNRTEPAGAVPVPGDTRLAIWTIDGLDEDDGRVLSGALRAALRVRGIAVAAVNDPKALVVTGWVERSPGRAGYERITIGWALLAADGQEIGVVSQANEVPVDTFNRNIGEAAPAIAGAAADGLIDALERHRRGSQRADRARP